MYIVHDNIKSIVLDIKIVVVLLFEIDLCKIVF